MINNKITISLLGNKYTLVAALLSICYLFVATLFGVNGVNPSDPLEYIVPIYNHEIIFPYFDRILLAPFLKIFQVFGVSPEKISWLAPVFINLSCIFIANFYILRKKSVLNACLFTFLMLISPFNVSTFSYLYPTGILTLALLCGTIILCKDKVTFFRSGLATVFILLSKIQGLPYIIQVVIEISKKNGKGKNTVAYVAGIVCSMVFLYLVIAVLFFDYLYPINVIKSYIHQNLDGQYHGYGGAFPKFYKYLSEPFVMSLLLLCILFRKNITREPYSYQFLFGGLLQAVWLLGIYFVTQRGGEVISNYFAPAVYMLTLHVALVFDAKDINKKYFSLFALTILLASLAFALHNPSPKLYTPLNNRGFELVAIFVLLASFLLIKSYPTIIGMLLFIPAIFSYKAQHENLSRILWSKPYESINTILAEVRGDICVNISLDEASESTKRRISMLASLYSSRISNVYFVDAQSQCNASLLLTNNGKGEITKPLINNTKKLIQCSISSSEGADCDSMVTGKYSEIKINRNGRQVQVANQGEEVANVYINMAQLLHKDAKSFALNVIGNKCESITFMFNYSIDKKSREKIGSNSALFNVKDQIPVMYIEGLYPKCVVELAIDEHTIMSFPNNVLKQNNQFYLLNNN